MPARIGDPGQIYRCSLVLICLLTLFIDLAALVLYKNSAKIGLFNFVKLNK